MIKVFLSIIVLMAGSVFLISFSSNNAKLNIGRADTIPSARKAITDKILIDLSTKAKSPADQVYPNLKTFNAANRITAKQLLDTMQYWSASLDVNCEYCHKGTDWASDELSAKQIARDMYTMQRTINTTLLTKVKDLASKDARVNCNTCHHGSVLPLE
jgi:hypothetical protein